MKSTFTITPVKYEKIQELPNGWANEDYIQLLDIMDYGDATEIPENELKEMTMMCLTDMEPDEASALVLAYIFKDKLTEGQIANLSHEMLDEKMWEEYADLSFHENFFNVAQLLYQAYNGKFPHPEAVQFKVSISTKNLQSLSIFKEDTEVGLIRILAQGMPENTLIRRLFEDQLSGGGFSEAKDIIWQLKSDYVDEKTVELEIISSAYWFQDFKYAQIFEAQIDAKDVIAD
jgi:hypothetical protein